MVEKRFWVYNLVHTASFCAALTKYLAKAAAEERVQGFLSVTAGKTRWDSLHAGRRAWERAGVHCVLDQETESCLDLTDLPLPTYLSVNPYILKHLQFIKRTLPTRNQVSNHQLIEYKNTMGVHVKI